MIETAIKHAPVKGVPFDTIARRLSSVKSPLEAAGRMVRDDIRADTVSRGWKRFKRSVTNKAIGDNMQVIFIDKSADADIAGFLHGGTKSHLVKPRHAKALHWTGGVAVPRGLSAGMKRGHFFSKGHVVSGIKATYFWGLYEATKEKIFKLFSEFISSRSK